MGTCRCGATRGASATPQQPVGQMVDLDRRQPDPLDAVHRRHRPQQPGQVEPGRRSRKQPEVDAGQHQLAVALPGPAGGLASTAAAARLRLAPRTYGITQ